MSTVRDYDRVNTTIREEPGTERSLQYNTRRNRRFRSAGRPDEKPARRVDRSGNAGRTTTLCLSPVALRSCARRLGVCSNGPQRERNTQGEETLSRGEASATHASSGTRDESRAARTHGVSSVPQTGRRRR